MGTSKYSPRASKSVPSDCIEAQRQNAQAQRSLSAVAYSYWKQEYPLARRQDESTEVLELALATGTLCHCLVCRTSPLTYVDQQLTERICYRHQFALHRVAQQTNMKECTTEVRVLHRTSIYRSTKK
jgi:hypothetical protein